jgi:type IV pilus assembly protein PilF
MRNARKIVLALLIATAGCAGQPPSSEVKPQSDTTGSETDARARARVHTELAAGYFELGNMSVALEEVQIALRSDADYSPAHNIAAIIYSQLKEDGQAEQHYLQALRIDPLDSDANNNYGWFLCQRNREEEGIRYFMAAVRNPLYRNADRSYVNAGLCYRQRGDLAGAEQNFLAALKVRPTQLQALYQMGDLSYLRSDYAAARSYLMRFTQLAPATAEVLWLAVRTERRLGDRESEASYAQQLRNRFPDSKEARALLGGQYE